MLGRNRWIDNSRKRVKNSRIILRNWPSTRKLT